MKKQSLLILPAIFSFCNLSVALGNVVTIDVGHYNEKPGAISALGDTELYYNQMMAVNLDEAFKYAGFKTRVNGYDGKLKSLSERARLAKGTDFFVSIHHDSVQEYDLMPWEVNGTQQRYTTKAKGFSVFVSEDNPYYKQSLVCAQSIANSLMDAGFFPNYYHYFNNPKGNFKLLYGDLPVYNYNKLVVLKNNEIPAILVEAGVILNPQEAVEFKNNVYRTKFAVATAKGLRKCLNDK